MTLATSGTMSIGGSTATRSINLELGLSATATSNMNSAALRGLAGVASGAISMASFYGASSSVGGEFIEVAGNVGGSVTLASAPQAGDLMIAGTGHYIYPVSPPNGFTTLLNQQSPNWSPASPIYFETSHMSYKIATGSEGTFVGSSGSTVVAVYRFNSPVTSISIQNSTPQVYNANKTLTPLQVQGDSFPNIYICVTGAYQLNNLTMTAQDFSNNYANVSMAASLRPEDHTAVNAVTTGTGMFIPAATFVTIAPNF